VSETAPLQGSLGSEPSVSSGAGTRILTSLRTRRQSSGLSLMTLLTPHFTHSFISSLRFTVQTQSSLFLRLHSARKRAPSVSARASYATENPWQEEKKYWRASGIDMTIANRGRYGRMLVAGRMNLGWCCQLRHRTQRLTHMPQAEDETGRERRPPVVDVFDHALHQPEQLDGVVPRFTVNLNPSGDACTVAAILTFSLTCMFSGCISMSITSANSGIG
jgi:hypothetical protein